MGCGLYNITEVRMGHTTSYVVVDRKWVSIILPMLGVGYTTS